MNTILSNKFAMLTVAVSILSIASPVIAAEQKLKIFILAGQSNMVGHANAHTIATLYNSENARDEDLIKLVFKEGSGLSKTALEEQLIQARKLDELSGGISFDKIKKMANGPDKSALEAKVKNSKTPTRLIRTMLPRRASYPIGFTSILSRTATENPVSSASDMVVVVKS